METQKKEVMSLMDITTRQKIRSLYTEGKMIKEIQAILNIPMGTWDSYFYDNKYGFRDFMNAIKKESFLMKAEKVSNSILSMSTDQQRASILAVIQKEAEFVRETLLKDEGYSKRIETIGLNINKNEPLDDDQKAKLDKLLRKSGAHGLPADVEIKNVSADDEQTTTSDSNVA
jgi:hypothetical protein